MTSIEVTDDGVVLVAGDARLVHAPRLVTLPDGSSLAAESQGGTLASVWAGTVGGEYVEVVHLGDGPVGGELVLVVPAQDVVSVGDLYTASEPIDVRPSWPEAIDLVAGLTTDRTTILTSDGAVTRSDLEVFHRRLLGALHG